MRYTGNISNAERLAEQRAYFLSMGGQGLARLLGGERLPQDKFGREGASVPGPGHGPEDRSLEVRIDPTQPDGIWVKTYSPRDTWQACKDHALQMAGFVPWQAGARRHSRVHQPAASPRESDKSTKGNAAPWLWAKSKPSVGSPVEPYLGSVRGGLKPTDMVRFLPADPPRYPHPR
jgi:hypothetical protein